MSRPSRQELLLLALIAAVSLGVRAAFVLSTDLFQDEAIYWCQAEDGVSFSPHPPAAQWMARLGTAAFGRHAAALRLGSLLAGTVTVVLAYVLARALAGGRAGVWAAALTAACPLFVALGSLATPDAPLLMLWLLFIWAAWRAVQGGGAAWWGTTGAVLAVGLYTKYMMVLAVPALGLAMIATPEGRRWLRRPAPWLALFGGAAAFAVPFLLWDWHRDWATLRYHLAARHEWAFDFELLSDYVIRHLGAISPLLLVAAVWGCVRWIALWRRGDARGAWIASFFAVPVLFFLLPSIFTERTMIRVHWDSIGYAAGLVGLACLLGERDEGARAGRRLRGVARTGLGVGVLFIAVLVSLSVWPGLPVRLGFRPPTRRMLGWRELAQRVREVREDWDGPRPFVLANSFRAALPLRFYLGAQERVYSLWHKRNVRYGLTEQMNEWGIDEEHLAAEQTGRDGLYVHEFHFSSHSRKDDPPTHIYRFVDKLEKLDDFYVEAGGERLKHFGLYRIRNLTPKRIKR